MLLEFTKMHGLGNDFIVIEDLAEELDFAPEAVVWLCDRNFGIGADGLILVRPATDSEAHFLMMYYNADGSTAEMCGNGIRCFAKYLVDHKLLPAQASTARVQTLGGVKSMTFTRDEAGLMDEATVDMGVPMLAPAQVPVDLPGERVVDAPLDTEEGTLNITALSMGNPHAVLWVDDVETAPVHVLGPLIETHSSFPAKTNVEFAQFLSVRHIRLRVWERGVGETLACGTGACATAVAGALSGRTNREVTVELPGGDLRILWDDDDRVLMTGPAVEVFCGVVAIDDEDTAS
ncbi:MAG: diaminopimelate epimerase [Coriobacteriia bacterium]|jgi:diaminopimelate epimerase|nr:diaminopimelate epimerase [Coriobacteriia bacterium]